MSEALAEYRKLIEELAEIELRNPQYTTEEDEVMSKLDDVWYHRMTREDREIIFAECHARRKEFKT